MKTTIAYGLVRAAVGAFRLAATSALLAVLLVPTSRATVIAFQKVKTTGTTTINENPGYQKVVVNSAGPFTVLAGDVVTAHIQQEVQWPDSTRIMTACGIVVATSPTAVDNTSTGYIGMISKFSGSNLDIAKEGTEVLTRTGSYQFATGYATVYINSIAYGQTLPQFTPGPDATIRTDYAELIAVIERGVTRYATSAYQSLPTDANGFYVPVGNSTLYTQYSVGPLTIPADSMVDVRFQVEASTPTNLGAITQRLGRKVIQTTSSTSTSGTSLQIAAQGGITNLEHHSTYGTGGGIYLTAGATGAYFNSVLWAWGDGTKLPIESESSTLYGGFAVEVRPYAGGYWKDTTRNITTADATQRVLYSVGPIDIPAGKVVEVRYQSAFQPSAQVSFDSQIVRGTSATAVSGVTVQRPLGTKFHPAYTYTNSIHSTAEQVSTAATGQYYNVVVWLPNGGTLPVMDWGQLEVVFR
jgi:hypothetical protein